jgi:hypothetical protein
MARRNAPGQQRPLLPKPFGSGALLQTLVGLVRPVAD